MPEEEIIAEFPECKICGCQETLTHKGWVHIYPDDEEVPFSAVSRTGLPMTSYTEAVNISLPVIPGMIICKDYCAGCGIERVTKAIRTAISMAALQQMQEQMGMMRKGPRNR